MDRRLRAYRLQHAEPCCCGRRPERVQLGECHKCGTWWHLLSACGQITQLAYERLRGRWTCPKCTGKGEAVRVAQEEREDEDGVRAREGGWIPVPVELRGVEGKEDVAGAAREYRGALFRNVAREYVRQCDLENRWVGANATLEQRRAELLTDATAAAKEAPIGVLKCEARRAPRAEELHLRCMVNGSLNSDAVPREWVDALPGGWAAAADCERDASRFTGANAAPGGGWN